MASTNFAGYLFKSGSDEFPNKYIQYDTYSSLPNSREEIKAYRDDNTRDLTRVTATGHKSSFSFTTTNLDLTAKQEIQTFFTSHYSDVNQRRLSIEYWNDEENTYKTGDFYVADMTFKIKTITDTNIYYEPVEISLVEY